ncbi:MAG: hypothetical protein JNL71_18080 [Rhodospirillales bacterium]|nr:hypothetical protein [Rhodospirillales bacterium]
MRSRFFAALCAGAVLVALPAQAQSLSGDEILASWGDKRLDATLPNGNRMQLVFRKDLTVHATGAATDQGVWKTTPTGYCTKWNRFNNREERCFTVVRRADGGFTVRTAAGAPSAEVAPLN